MSTLSTGVSNTVVGSNNGVTNQSGSNNVFVGNNIATIGSGSASGNTVVGSDALMAASAGSQSNSAFGHKALAGVTTGVENTGVGFRAGFLEGDATRSVTTGSHNTFIGTNTSPSATGISNSTAIGYQAQVAVSNTIQLGNGSVTEVRTSGTLTAAGLESIGTTLNIASQNNTTTLNIGSGTAVQTVNMGNNGVGVTTINLGGGSDVVNLGRTTCTSLLSFGQQTKDKMLALFSSNNLDPNNPSDHRYYGFGVADGGASVPPESGVGWIRYQVPQSMQHRFYTGTNSATASNERFRIAADGKVSLGSGGSLEAISGDLNIGDSTSTINIAKSSTTQIVNIGTGTGLTTINMGGNVTSSAVPTAGSHLTNKTYVDSKVMPINNQSLNTTDTVTFGGIKLSTDSVLNFYERWTSNTAYSGPALVSSQFIYFTRVGALVTMSSNQIQFTATSNGFVLANTNVPSHFRPISDQYMTTFMRINDQSLINGVAVLSSYGFLRIYKSNLSTFQTGENVVIYAISSSWALWS